MHGHRVRRMVLHPCRAPCYAHVARSMLSAICLGFQGVQMTVDPRDEITQLLRVWSEGDQGALEKLIPLVYEELRRRAHRYMARERPDHILQTTALVHEAYVQLVDANRANWQDRAHFLRCPRRSCATFWRTGPVPITHRSGEERFLPFRWTKLWWYPTRRVQNSWLSMTL